MNFILETLSEVGEAYIWLLICAVGYVIGKRKEVTYKLSCTLQKRL